jgi:hypothetical protein
MQVHCNHCHRPYALNKNEVHAALDLLEEHQQGHYNTPCPHCGRINRVSRNELQRAAPDWIKTTTEETKAD